ncbi:MAG: GLPGLI family protein, partial [Sediminibacterium sp.]|nr:GLPGLI family protein [Sediminibacterium sp.]
LWVDLDWVILDSLKLIEGFNCRKATTNFRGRKYDVWFTDSIQVPYGPWKLFDLPGLILEMLEVEENLLFITAKKITYPINTELVINEPNEKTIVSVKELDAFMEKQAELRWEAAKSELPRGFNIGRGKRTEPYFFRKLERKYEWE